MIRFACPVCAAKVPWWQAWWAGRLVARPCLACGSLYYLHEHRGLLAALSMIGTAVTMLVVPFVVILFGWVAAAVVFVATMIAVDISKVFGELAPTTAAEARARQKGCLITGLVVLAIFILIALTARAAR